MYTMVLMLALGSGAGSVGCEPQLYSACYGCYGCYGSYGSYGCYGYYVAYPASYGCCGYYGNPWVPDYASRSQDGATGGTTGKTGSGEGTGGTEPAEMNADEMKWLEDLSKDKTGEEKTKFEQLWRSMSHKERKEFWDEIKGIREKSGDKDKKDEGAKDNDKGQVNHRPYKAGARASRILPLVGPRQGIVTVLLPAGAKLSFNDQAIPARSTLIRRFTTPLLEPGERYYYDIHVTTVVDGKEVSLHKKAYVEPGKESTVSFEGFSTVRMASK